MTKVITAGQRLQMVFVFFDNSTLLLFVLVPMFARRDECRANFADGTTFRFGVAVLRTFPGDDAFVTKNVIAVVENAVETFRRFDIARTDRTDVSTGFGFAAASSTSFLR